jgi:hypothetical protein
MDRQALFRRQRQQRGGRRQPTQIERHAQFEPGRAACPGSGHPRAIFHADFKHRRILLALNRSSESPSLDVDWFWS